jgi:FkbM family methyltransferase
VIKNGIKKIFNYIGFNIERISLYKDDSHHLRLCTDELKIDLVIDAGANRGQFASKLFESGYKGSIVSIEPLSSAWAMLEDCRSKSPWKNRWLLYPRCALGSKESLSVINISRNLDSSSILPMTASHEEAAPWSHYIGTEECLVYPLDKIFSNFNASEKNVLLKIDCQGFEHEILLGARQSLNYVRAVLTEVSLIELYGGQKLWLDILSYMEESGFQVYSMIKGFTDPKTGRTLQMDILFVRVD